MLYDKRTEQPLSDLSIIRFPHVHTFFLSRNLQCQRTASLNSTMWTVLAFMSVQGQDLPFLRQFVLVLLLLQRAKLANIARGLSGLLHACAGC